MKKSIVWFKTDLRLHDNETLMQAIFQSDAIIPVYCFEDQHYDTTSFGFKKTGSFRAQFIIESVIELDNQLRERGSGLIVLKGKAEEEITKLAIQFGVQKVFAKKEVAYEEKQTEEKLEKELWKHKIDFHKYSTSTLYHAEDLPFSIKEIPDIFTTFRKKVEKEASIRKSIESPKNIISPQIPSSVFPSLFQLGLKEEIADNRGAFNFKGGETEALKRLEYYFFESKKILTYKETRNELIGADYSSKFSAWLAQGCLSPREIYHQIKKFESQNGENESTYWLIFELLWRDYFRFMMKKYAHKYFQENGIKEKNPIKSQHIPSVVEKWTMGKTDEDFVNANMNELRLTGFMSNRGRQNVASYFCSELMQDWRYGAAYFEQQLIDYDPCSNWGNWAYIAGVGNDPRGKRTFNTEKQAKDYDKKGEYRKLWNS